MKKRIPLTLTLFSLLLAAQVLLSFGTPLMWLLQLYVHEVLAFILLRILEAAGLLILLATLGAAFAYVARGRRGGAVLLLLSGTGAHLLGTVLSLIWQALFFRQAISATTLGLLLSAVVETSLLPPIIAFFLSLTIFLKKAANDEPRGFRDTKSPAIRAAILSSALFFVIRLFSYILTVADFIKESFGFIFIDTGEKLTLILDAIPVIAVPLIGYFLLLTARRRTLALLDAVCCEPQENAKKPL